MTVCAQVSNKFVPLLPGRSGQDSNHIATLKSVIEVIRMKKQYEVLDAVNQDPQLELAQLLLGKVAEESCLWVSNTIIGHLVLHACHNDCSFDHNNNLQLNESPDINIPDCTNIDLSLLEELYLRMDLYQTLQSTLTDVRRIMNDASTHDIYTCAWMDHRILNNCATDHNTNYDHRNTLNMLCDDSPFCASAQLCTRT